jgi:hypothetical protein
MVGKGLFLGSSRGVLKSRDAEEALELKVPGPQMEAEVEVLTEERKSREQEEVVVVGSCGFPRAGLAA